MDVGNQPPSGKIDKIKGAWAEARRFFREELWDVNLSTLPRMRQCAVASARVLHMIVKGFIGDKCTLQASALTYFTLMAMVPVLALMLAVSKGFRAQDRLLYEIGLQFDATSREFTILSDSRLAELPAEMVAIIKEVFLAVENTNFGTVGIIGIALLFFSVVKMMGRIEKTFNSIWGVQKSRSMIRKFADYISVLVTFPILLLMAISANAALRSSRLTETLQARLGPFFWFYQSSLSLTSVMFVIIGFSLLYMFMPNTKVKAFPSLAGGILGGICFLAWQWFYFTVQIEAAKQNPIYGTFAAIPLFLIFVQIGWLLVLLGAEVAFALQNYATYHLETSAKTLSFATQQLLGMLFVVEICQAFRAGSQWNATDYTSSHNIPSRITTAVLGRLVDNGVVIAINENGTGKTGGYVPGRDLETLTVAHVQQALRGEPLNNVRLILQEKCPHIFDRIQQLEREIGQNLGETTFSQILAH